MKGRIGYNGEAIRMSKTQSSPSHILVLIRHRVWRKPHRGGRILHLCVVKLVSRFHMEKTKTCLYNLVMWYTCKVRLISSRSWSVVTVVKQCFLGRLLLLHYLVDPDKPINITVEEGTPELILQCSTLRQPAIWYV